MKQAIIFLPFFTREWLGAAFDLHSNLERNHVSARLVDISHFSLPRRADVETKLTMRRYPFLERLSAPSETKNQIDEKLRENLAHVCELAMKSLTRMEHPTILSPVNYLTRKIMLSRCLKLWRALRANLEGLGSVDTVYIPNGRFPVDKVLTQFFNDEGVVTKFWEMDQGHTGYFVSDWEIHERSKIQPLLRSQVEDFLEDDGVAHWALEWLKNRESKNNNPFASHWSSDHQQNSPDSRLQGQLAVFFTSSSDELGATPESEIVELDKQHSAVRRLAEAFVTTKHRFWIRVHPNLNNKPLSQFFSEMRAYKKIAKDFTHVQIIPPWSRINSYELVRKADIVLVHGSTIGLEASALGKPVVTTQRTPYSEIIDIREVLSDSDLPKLHLQRELIDSRRALAYIEYTNRSRIIFSRPIEEFRRSSNKTVLAGVKIFLESPLDAILSFWFNYKWVATKILVNGGLKHLPHRSFVQ